MTNPTARFETSLGSFRVEILEDKMPIAAKNFLDLAPAASMTGCTSTA